MTTIFDIDPNERSRPVMVLDFEASGLGKGTFPIEVAVVDVDTTETRSWLIRPTRVWATSGIWDPVAEGLHGISRETLLAEGVSVEAVCAELAEAVAGRSVVTDGVAADSAWLATLYAAVGLEPPCRLEPVGPLMGDLTSSGGLASAGEIEAAMDVARQQFPHVHRAANDARRLTECLRILAGLAA